MAVRVGFVLKTLPQSDHNNKKILKALRLCSAFFCLVKILIEIFKFLIKFTY